MIDDCDALIDLFRQLQPELGLKIEQYELLVEAWEKGYGHNSWADLRRICRLIWLKTSDRLDPLKVNVFDRIFDLWQADCERSVRDWFKELKPEQPEAPPVPTLGILPTAPPPRMSTTKSPPTQTPAPNMPQPPQAPVAAKVNKSRIAIRQLPIGMTDVVRVWRSLKRSIPDRRQTEFDLDATIDKLNREGYLYELVMRSTTNAAVDLLLLIDDHHHMRPYRPVYEPLVRAISSHRLTSAKIYRFISYPVDYLDDGHDPLKSIELGTLLSRLHSQHTVVLIVSDAGAATASYSQ